MNILLLTNCISQPDDTDKSVNDLVFTFASEWKKSGHNVVIINSESKFPFFYYYIPKRIVKLVKKFGNFTVPSIASRKELRWEREGITIARFPMFKLYPHSSFSEKQIAEQEKRIILYLRELNFCPEVVTGHWIEPQLKLVNMLGSYYRAKKGLVIHGEIPKQFSPKKWAEINSLDMLFFRSFHTRDNMTKTYGSSILKCKTDVCYSGVPDSFINNQGRRIDWKDGGVFRVIYVGRLERYKRIDCTLLALKKAFKDENFSFDVVGDGPERESLVQLSKKLDIDKRVLFHGRVNRNEVIEIMRKADCFVMASENEVFGLVYLEAMSCGCITVASIDGGVDGILINGKNGFLTKQGDYNALSSTLETINSLSNQEVSIIRKNAYDTLNDYSDSAAAEHYLASILRS